MASTDTYPLVDRIVPGGLPPFLAAARERGESFETIAYRLRNEHGIAVTSETIRKWCGRAEAEAAS